MIFKFKIFTLIFNLHTCFIYQINPPDGYNIEFVFKITKIMNYRVSQEKSQNRFFKFGARPGCPGRFAFVDGRVGCNAARCGPAGATRCALAGGATCGRAASVGLLAPVARGAEASPPAPSR